MVLFLYFLRRTHVFKKYKGGNLLHFGVTEFRVVRSHAHLIAIFSDDYTEGQPVERSCS